MRNTFGEDGLRDQIRFGGRVGGNRRTLWGLIDRTRGTVRYASAAGWLVIAVLTAGFIALGVSAVTSSRDMLYLTGLIVVPTFAWGLYSVLANARRFEPVFAGLQVIPEAERPQPQVDAALAGAMLATGTGRRPALYELTGDGVNACVDTGSSGPRAIAVTAAMRGSLTPAELEAVLTQLLVRARMPDRLAITERSDDLEVRADAEAARLLGYPDDLFSALEKTLARDTRVAVASDISPRVRFFAAPWSNGPSAAQPRQHRVDELRSATRCARAGESRRTSAST